MTETYEYWKTLVDTLNPGKNYHVFKDVHCYVDDSHISFYNGIPTPSNRHRWNGPAIIWDDGEKQFFFNDNVVAQYRSLYSYPLNCMTWKWYGRFYDWTLAQGIDIDNITDEDVILIKMVWA